MTMKKSRTKSSFDFTSLRSALEIHELVNNDLKIASALAKKCKIKNFKKDETLIVQGEQDSGVHFILSGSVDVEINGSVVATRRHRQHVGEMASIEPYMKRSATIRAKESCRTAFIEGKDFVAVCDLFPQLWKPIALQVSSRLRDRGLKIRVPNHKPRIFIGSSGESLRFAESLKVAIESVDCEVIVWHEKEIFKLSRNTLEDLKIATQEFDFAILILSPDDKVISRRKLKPAPRDNLIYELGLFMGSLGSERTYFISPSDFDIKIPSDLFGITNIRCKFGKRGPNTRSVEKIADQIKYQLGTLGTRKG